MRKARELYAKADAGGELEDTFGLGAMREEVLGGPRDEMKIAELNTASSDIKHDAEERGLIREDFHRSNAVCYQCGSPATKQCSACRAALYCSATCQGRHSSVCRKSIWKLQAVIVLDIYRVVKRRATDEKAEEHLEEERRLAHVAVTRDVWEHCREHEQEVKDDVVRKSNEGGIRNSSKALVARKAPRISPEIKLCSASAKFEATPGGAGATLPQ